MGRGRVSWSITVHPFPLQQEEPKSRLTIGNAKHHAFLQTKSDDPAFKWLFCDYALNCVLVSVKTIMYSKRSFIIIMPMMADFISCLSFFNWVGSIPVQKHVCMHMRWTGRDRSELETPDDKGRSSSWNNFIGQQQQEQQWNNNCSNYCLEGREV